MWRTVKNTPLQWMWSTRSNARGARSMASAAELIDFVFVIVKTGLSQLTDQCSINVVRFLLSSFLIDHILYCQWRTKWGRESPGGVWKVFFFILYIAETTKNPSGARRARPPNSNKYISSLILRRIHVTVFSKPRPSSTICECGTSTNLQALGVSKQ